METEKEREREQTTFHRLQRFVRAFWGPWDGKNYPLLDPKLYVEGKVPEALKLMFAAPHVMTHVDGALGTIAKNIEPCGHGTPFTEEQRAAVEEAIAKLFVSGLMLASLLDIEAGRIPEVMRRVMEDHASQKIRELRAEHGIPS